MRLILDFYDILSHEYRELVASNNETRNPRWWTQAFGGEERLSFLKSTFDVLEKIGVKLVLCTDAVETEVHDVLHLTGLLHFFMSKEKGLMRFIAFPDSSKAERVKAYSEYRPGNHVLFVGSDDQSCREVQASTPGISVLCIVQGLDPSCVSQIKWFFQSKVPAEQQTSDMQVIFDFDNTLAKRMVWQDLGGHAGATKDHAETKPREWWIQEFGGQERLNMLSHMLSDLQRCRVKCYVCSNNDDDVIKVALAAVDLDPFFTGRNGSARILERKFDNGKYAPKSDRIRHNLARTEDSPENTLFVDDDAKNLIDAQQNIPGIGVYQCLATEGLQPHDVDFITGFFHHRIHSRVSTTYPMPSASDVPNRDRAKIAYAMPP